MYNCLLIHETKSKTKSLIYSVNSQSRIQAVTYKRMQNIFRVTSLCEKNLYNFLFLSQNYIYKPICLRWVIRNLKIRIYNLFRNLGWMMINHCWYKFLKLQNCNLLLWNIYILIYKSVTIIIPLLFTGDLLGRNKRCLPWESQTKFDQRTQIT